MVYLSWTLLWFEAISRLNINLEKSFIMSVGIVEDLDSLAIELGCRMGNLPTTYLGMRCSSVLVWDRWKKGSGES